MANNQIPGMGFHHIALRVKDFERERKFLTEGLGLKPYATWRGGPNGEKEILLLEIGNGGMIELFSLGSDEPECNNRFFHFAFHVADVDAAYKRAMEAGAESVMEPAVRPVPSTPVALTLNCAFVRSPGGAEFEFIRVLDAKEL